jgi:hypothetical protein
VGNKLQDWHIGCTIANHRIQVGSDSILWPLNKNGTFTLKSLYRVVLVKDENGRKRSKTDLRYRKTKTVGSEYFYI